MILEDVIRNTPSLNTTLLWIIQNQQPMSDKQFSSLVYEALQILIKQGTISKRRINNVFCYVTAEHAQAIDAERGR
jgi:hypothetical protein